MARGRGVGIGNIGVELRRQKRGVVRMRIFRVSFHSNGKVYQLHAQQISQADLYGFIEISDLLFDEHTSLVIDPAEEKLKAEFAGVQRLLLPMHAVMRIEEVEK
ncbi:MAG: DUF1820 family protein, partial [Anaerolineae bacterium]|nr:DUF1820 family protein [Anaerolineae bacterium]